MENFVHEGVRAYFNWHFVLDLHALKILWQLLHRDLSQHVNVDLFEDLQRLLANKLHSIQPIFVLLFIFVELLIFFGDLLVLGVDVQSQLCASLSNIVALNLILLADRFHLLNDLLDRIWARP